MMQPGMQPLTLKDTIGPKIPILDHGYIQAIEAWGCDERIIEAARMSTGKGFQGWGPSTVIECPDNACPGYSWQANDLVEAAIDRLKEEGLRHALPSLQCTTNC
jgi:hypothetical protein